MARLLIIDGYNVIRSTQPYLELAQNDNWDHARDALLNDVAMLVNGEIEVTVVFDGTSNPQSQGTPEKHLGMTVIFSPFGKTADTVIEKMARLARERGDSVEVVTSDAQTQWAVMGQRVIRRSSREFTEYLSDEVSGWQKENSKPRKRVTLEDRISPEAAKALRKLSGHE